MTDKEEKSKEIKSIPEKPKEEMLKHEEVKAITESTEARIKELEDQLKRLQAEFENYKKRVAKEKEELAVTANGILLAKLLPIIDDFEIVLTHAKKAKKEEMQSGLEMLFKNFMTVLTKEGLEEMKVMGETFDPYKHEAVKSEESDVEEGKIIDVVKKGYLFKDRIIRHAMVVVSKGKKKSEEKNI
jgi:molecular chaperone GrpE